MNAPAASRSSRSALSAASRRVPRGGRGADSARRPSIAPPSISALSASIAMRPSVMLTSPITRSGFCVRRTTSLRPCNQASSASGSAQSMLSVPAKLPCADDFGLLVKETWVVPGARMSKRSIAQDALSPRMASDTFCSGRPPSMICSVLASILVLIGARGISAIAASSADSIRDGAATLPSFASSLALSLASNLSASIWRAVRTARSSGAAPNLTSPRPASFIARSSAP